LQYDDFAIEEFPCWPTPIVQFGCALSDADDLVLKRLVEERSTRRETDLLSQVGGWRTETDLLQISLPAVENLIALIYDACEQLHEAICLGLDSRPLPPLRAEAWGNKYSAYDFQIPHIHHDSVFSGVYYVAVPDTESPGNIELLDPRGGAWRDLRRAPSLISVRPRKGTMIAFPSWLRHSVRPHRSESARISIAFNVGIERA
jgi:uncharacterized protein (TIGR02466 family)